MPPKKKKTDAQIARAKAKDQKKKKAVTAQSKQDKEDAGFAPGEHRATEESIIVPKLQALKLRPVETPADGDCLFTSALHQLHTIGGGNAEFADLKANVVKVPTALALRKLLADFIRASPEIFGPFIVAEDVGAKTASNASDDQKKVQMYADKISKNSEIWGGHLEIVAAASLFNVSISVISDKETQVVEAANGTKATTRWTLIWWQHKFALGAHYEATVEGVATMSASTKTGSDREDEDDDDEDDE